MKKTMNKKKLSLATIGAAMLSFSSKAMGQIMNLDNMQDVYGVPPTQSIYKISSHFLSPESITIKIVQRALVGITFIIGIVNLIKIRRINDKVQRNKRIKRTIIILAVLAVILVATFLVPTLLLK